MRTPRAGVVAAGLLLALAGCAAERWENPSIDPAFWSEDEEDCREVAAGTAEHRYDLDEDESPEVSLDYGQPEQEYAQQMDAFDAEGAAQSTFRGCMLQRGYQLVDVDAR